MNLVRFVILTFCIHQVFGQENVRSGDFAKAINFNSNVSQQKVSVEDTPDEFIINKPLKTDKTYDDFLSFLYRGDKAKSKVKRAIDTGSTVNDVNRKVKRMIVFRPMFVYKQQEIKRQRVKGSKTKNKGPTKKTNKG